jgi:hypothetical protein
MPTDRRAADSRQLQEHSRTTKAKLAPLLHANHQWREIPFKNPKVQLAAELSLRAHTFQEQSPGACAQALHQKGSQSGLQHSHRQLVNGKLACANKANVASKNQVPNARHV